MRALALLLVLACACDPISVFVRDVQPLPDGSLRVERCESLHDLAGRHVDGECHVAIVKVREK